MLFRSQIPREQGTLNGAEPHKTLYQQTSTIKVCETHDFFGMHKSDEGFVTSFALAELVVRFCEKREIKYHRILAQFALE